MASDTSIFLCRSPTTSTPLVGINRAFVRENLLQTLSTHKLNVDAILRGDVRHGVLSGSKQAAMQTLLATMLVTICEIEPRLRDSALVRECKTSLLSVPVKKDWLSLLRVVQRAHAETVLDMHNCVWTRWYSSSDDAHYGVFHRVRDSLWRDCQDSEPDSEQRFHAQLALSMLLNDARFWSSSRVFQSFFVLFERVDGTILVSEDFERVYLVVDIELRLSLRISLLFSSMALSNEEIDAHIDFRQRNTHVKDAIVGYKARLTLLPFEDSIVTDGAIYECALLSESQIIDALDAYRLAVEDDKVLVSLPRVEPPELQRKPVDSDELLQRWMGSSVGEQVMHLIQWPLHVDNKWEFNVSWSDEDNRFSPVLNTFQSYSIVVQEDIHNAECYLRALCGACVMLQRRPGEISFRGDKNVFLVLHHLLEEVAIEILFFDLYVSPEELFLLTSTQATQDLV